MQEIALTLLGILLPYAWQPRSGAIGPGYGIGAARGWSLNGSQARLNSNLALIDVKARAYGRCRGTPYPNIESSPLGRGCPGVKHGYQGRIS